MTTNNAPNMVPRRGFTSLFNMLEELERQKRTFDLPIELIAAVAVKESHANMWFCKCDMQYKENMRTAVQLNAKSEANILRLITVTEGPYANHIPKFRYELSWREDALRLSRRMKDRQDWAFRMACSYGMCQKSMWIHLSAKPIEQWESAYWQFLTDPFEQLHVCASDLHYLLKAARGNLDLALTRYNAGPGANHISDYGEKVKGLYLGFLSSEKRGK